MVARSVLSMMSGKRLDVIPDLNRYKQEIPLHTEEDILAQVAWVIELAGGIYCNCGSIEVGWLFNVINYVCKNE